MELNFTYLWTRRISISSADPEKNLSHFRQKIVLYKSYGLYYLIYVLIRIRKCSTPFHLYLQSWKRTPRYKTNKIDTEHLVTRAHDSSPDTYFELGKHYIYSELVKKWIKTTYCLLMFRLLVVMLLGEVCLQGNLIIFYLECYTIQQTILV